MAAADEEHEKAIQHYKMKKLIKELDNSKGNGTSMISLIIPPGDQVARVTKLLNEELGTAVNIKSRVNKLSVLSAITSTVQKLKTYQRIPKNGLALYCGTILTQKNSEKRVSYAIEPFKPINTSLYYCDNKFHTQPLRELLESDDKFGFIIMDGNGCLFGTLCGNTREVLHKFSVDLPKKHGRGGQSAMRFARIRLEKRHHYIRKVAEVATQMFISHDRPNVVGLILAGSADFKTKLGGSDMFDVRLEQIILQTVDVSYGGENGFNQAIDLAQETLKNLKFINEKKLLSNYYAQISQDTGKYCFGVRDTMHALELGAIEELIIFEDLDLKWYELRNNTTHEKSTKILSPAQAQDGSAFQDQKTQVDLEIIEEMDLTEWFSLNYKNYGAKLFFVSDKSAEGSQFLKGFGGIGGLLRYQVDFMVLDDMEFMDYGNDDSDEFCDDDFM